MPELTAAHLNYSETPEQNRRVEPAPGLCYRPDLISAGESGQLITHIDQSDWNTDLQRRTQHYGWRYDYQAKSITPDMYLGQLPPWLQSVAERIFEQAVDPATGQRLFDRRPEQCIINEYVGAQGIAEHTDHPGFGPAIATVSLLVDWEMDFAPRYRAPKQPALLEANSCLTMTGASRHNWTHQIQPYRDRPRQQRRISLTFRTVLNRDNVNE